MNPECAEMLGYCREELLGRNILELGVVHPDDVQAAREIIRGLLSGEEPARTRPRYKRKDSQVILVDVLPTALRDERGEIIGIISVARDISEQLAAQEALEESEERYRLLYENMGEAVYTYNRGGDSCRLQPDCPGEDRVQQRGDGREARARHGHTAP